MITFHGLQPDRAPSTLAGLASSGMATPEMVTLLSDALAARQNVLVGGWVGSGRTTVLRCLAAHMRVPTVWADGDVTAVEYRTGVNRMSARPLHVLDPVELVVVDDVHDIEAARYAIGMLPGGVRPGERVQVLASTVSTSPGAGLVRIAKLLGGERHLHPADHSFTADEVVGSFDLFVQVKRGGRRRHIEGIYSVDSQHAGIFRITQLAKYAGQAETD